MSTLFLLEFFPIAPVRPLTWASATPVRERVLLPRNGEVAAADLYRPSRPGRFGAVVVLLGVKPLDLSDPLVVQLGESLARINVIALIPESPDLKAGRVTAEEVPAIVAAVGFLRDMPYVQAERIGLAGFSVGASLAVLAAADERIAGDVAALNLFGPYADARALMAAVLTKQQRLDGDDLPWEPSDFSRDLVARFLLEAVENDTDRSLLRSALDANSNPTGLALTTDAGRAVALLLHSPQPDEVDALLSTLSPGFQERLDRLSPALTARRLRAAVFLMHDRNDTFVPLAESRRLRAAIPPPSLRRYAEFDLFAHVVPATGDNGPLRAQEFARLWLYVRDFLSYLTS